ncbi:MAG: TIGR02206 family membrane protein [Verrucomicrobiales bacterium]|nr:TIGR02206 family membrane protein [Verrucomicrobiales bacterium]
MELQTFHPGSPVHLIAIGTCLIISVWVALANRVGSTDTRNRIVRRGIALLCLLTWVLSVGFWLHPSVLDWSVALPLHFCHFANLFGAVAILRKTRIAQSLLYFWGFGLCSWALLTPSLSSGPATLWFWVFWFYHLCIPLTLAWVLVVDRFRPTFSDLKRTLLVTFAFTGALFLLNLATGWDYGFVGEGKPNHPSPIDFLGPYPLRVIWMLIIGTAIFSLLYLPWIRLQKASNS